jgi:hypothetical protein
MLISLYNTKTSCQLKSKDVPGIPAIRRDPFQQSQLHRFANPVSPIHVPRLPLLFQIVLALLQLLLTIQTLDRLQLILKNQETRIISPPWVQPMILEDLIYLLLKAVNTVDSVPIQTQGKVLVMQ